MANLRSICGKTTLVKSTPSQKTKAKSKGTFDALDYLSWSTPRVDCSVSRVGNGGKTFRLPRLPVLRVQTREGRSRAHPFGETLVGTHQNLGPCRENESVEPEWCLPFSVCRIAARPRRGSLSTKMAKFFFILVELARIMVDPLFL